MNLIEKLGGYEEAKDALDLPLNYDFSDDDICKALLDYRRENNIFEDGDMIVFSVMGNEVVQYADWLKSQNKDWIRHATNEEINRWSQNK